MPFYVMTLLVTGPPDEVESVAERHREHLRALRAEGKLHTAGEFSNGEGFLEILDVADRVEADRIARSAPLVEEGLASWMLREWVEL
jgi:uncharacterized protein YciI